MDVDVPAPPPSTAGDEDAKAEAASTIAPVASSTAPSSAGGPYGLRSVDVDGRPVYARLVGVMFAGRDWNPGMALPLSAGFRTALVRALPFTIGRGGADADDFYNAQNPRVSRKHATIDYDYAAKRWFIRCESRNPIVVDNEAVNNGQSRELHSRSAIRIGGFYFYFLLPLCVVMDGPEIPGAVPAASRDGTAGGTASASSSAGGGASAAGGAGAASSAGAPRSRPKPLEEWVAMLEAVYTKFYESNDVHCGYMAMSDAMASIRAE